MRPNTRSNTDGHPIIDRSSFGMPFFDFYLTSDRYKMIKRLFLCRIDWNGFEREELIANLVNCMCQLEELSIDQTNLEHKNMYAFPDLTENWTANLSSFTFSNLKVLSMKQDFREKFSITAPRLEKLII